MKKMLSLLLCALLMLSLCACAAPPVRPLVLTAAVDAAADDSEATDDAAADDTAAVDEIALTVGERSYSLAEMNYCYVSEYNRFMDSYGSFAATIGLDVTRGYRGLFEQTCSFSSAETWRDFFLNTAVQNLRQITALAEYAAAEGIELTEDELAQIDQNLAPLADAAAAYGFADGEELLAFYYGEGVDTALVRRMSEQSSLATKAYAQYAESLHFTPEELAACYAGLNGERDFFDFLLLPVTAAIEEGAEAPDEDALQRAHAEAETLAEAYRAASGEDFRARLEAAAQERSEDVQLRQSIAGGSLDENYRAWLTAPERQSGEAAVVDASFGSCVVVFLAREDNRYPTVSVRHILVMAEADEEGNYTDEAKAAALARAEEILAEYEAGERTEESFAALAEACSADLGSNTRGGLYEEIYHGQMIEAFDAFCFADHEPGDTGIVFGSTSSYAGYHVMYYVGEGENYCDVIAGRELRDAAQSAWLEEIAAQQEAVPGDAYDQIGLIH